MTCPFLTKSRVFQHTEKSISEKHVNLVFGKNSLVAQLVKNLPAARETWVQCGTKKAKSKQKNATIKNTPNPVSSYNSKNKTTK